MKPVVLVVGVRREKSLERSNEGLDRFRVIIETGTDILIKISGCGVVGVIDGFAITLE
jgi:hypothetical protein